MRLERLVEERLCFCTDGLARGEESDGEMSVFEDQSAAYVFSGDEVKNFGSGRGALLIDHESQFHRQIEEAERLIGHGVMGD